MGCVCRLFGILVVVPEACQGTFFACGKDTRVELSRCGMQASYTFDYGPTSP